MKCLLDTHALLWFLKNDEKLSDFAREVIEDADNDVFLSIASLWEIAIKVSIGKLSLPKPFSDLFPSKLDSNDIILLPIELSHLAAGIQLPFHHRDPFDRLLVVQAITEDLTLISTDQVFDAYGVKRLW